MTWFRSLRLPLFLGLAVLAVVIRLTLWGGQPSPEPAPEQATLEKPKRDRDLTVRRARPHRAPAPLPQEPPPAALPADLPIEEPELPEGLAVVVVDIVNEDGRPDDQSWVVPVDCPGWTYGSRDGEYRAAPGPCTLRAARHDGALMARGSIVTAELSESEPTYVQLEIGSQPTGGIGIRFRPTENGIRVLDVAPGTPAHAAGLQPGDLIVAVGGEDVSDFDTDAFVERMTGAVGTDVEFTVGIESDTGIGEETVRVTRAFLDI